jgi:septin family protein
MSDDKEIHIVVVGEAGNGKSTLCNTLIGKNNIFKESSEPECETKITSGQIWNFR